MDKFPKVSIITPVYKAEKYINRCLDSILSQTFSDWECILVDDGSPDNSGLICDEYAKLDSRFRVIHKKNGGVADARQVGIDAAFGEFSIHVDPDDYIKSSLLGDMYSEAIRQNVDVLVCDYTVVFGSGKELKVVQKPLGNSTDALFEDILLQRLHGSLCNKIVRQSCYKDYGVRFYPGINNCEDVLIWGQLSKCALSVGYLPNSYYYYCLNENSITSKNSYTIGNYNALKRYIDIVFEFDNVSLEAKLTAAHAVKMKALENDVMNREEYYSFYPPNFRVVLYPNLLRDKIFGIFAYFKLYHLGLIVYKMFYFTQKLMSLGKKQLRVLLDK